MRSVEYLDLPSVPNEIRDEVISTLEQTSLLFNYADVFKTYVLPPNAEQFVREIFPPPYIGRVHVLRGKIENHVDFSNAVVRYNYLLDAGGDVETRFHDKPFDVTAPITERFVIEPSRWHRLTVFRPHSLSKIEEGRQRVAITVTLNTSKEDYASAIRLLDQLI